MRVVDARFTKYPREPDDYNEVGVFDIFTLKEYFFISI